MITIQQTTCYSIIILLCLSLAGCASDSVSTMNIAYDSKAMAPIPANRSRVMSDDPHFSNAVKQGSAVLTSYNMTNNPEVLKAFHDYLKTGRPKSIRGQGFLTLPYDAYHRPILACAPLMVCEIILERNENVNAVSLGDTLRWQVQKIQVGTHGNRSWVILFKPERLNIATNMTIATSKRIYQFGLISKADATPVVVNFWYPNEMMATINHVNPSSNESVGHMPLVDENHLDFHYVLKGDKPSWRPVKVFNDGVKTFIDFPSTVDRTQLPVLYAYRNKKLALINYRYRRPFMIADGIFRHAKLISGKGFDQTVVEIIYEGDKQS